MPSPRSGSRPALLTPAAFIPETLRAARAEGHVIPFVGAGASMAVLDVLVREAERERMRARLQGLPLELLPYADHGAPLVVRVRELAAVRAQHAAAR